MKTLKNRPTRSGLATLSVALMLALSACGGGQATAESSKTATNTPVASTSASASAASTPTTAKVSASASVAAEPKGSEIIEIRTADDTNADDAIAKAAAIEAAKRVVAQDNRLLNAWMHGDFEHTSDEELSKYVYPDTMTQVKEDIQSARNDLKNNGGPFTGNVTMRNVEVSDILTHKYQDGSSHPYSALRVKYCMDWTQVHTPDGERAVTGPDSTATVEVSVMRLQDGRYTYAGMRQLNSGCASS
ncbi:methyl coenzyme M reductase subunit gamma [Rothia mucilaginosa]|uniref:methyl coenzyme M reductase subunit gamma n=1 Tax=Rothia mucilaginosa TaxID=43675 RepID=UPI0028D6D60A|nr:methyl coenzyme M reductase subunit gamma [Rothia mucilaginosa]